MELKNIWKNEDDKLIIYPFIFFPDILDDLSLDEPINRLKVFKNALKNLLPNDLDEFNLEHSCLKKIINCINEES